MRTYNDHKYKLSIHNDILLMWHLPNTNTMFLKGCFNFTLYFAVLSEERADLFIGGNGLCLEYSLTLLKDFVLFVRFRPGVADREPKVGSVELLLNTVSSSDATLVAEFDLDGFRWSLRSRYSPCIKLSHCRSRECRNCFRLSIR